MKTLGYYNGKIAELDEMQVPMLDRACYFGDGVYDVTYTNGGKIFDEDAHLDKFYFSAKLIDLIPPISKIELKTLLYDLIKKTDDKNLWVYMQMSRGSAIRAHAFPKDRKVNLWIMLRPGQIRPMGAPMSCITYPDLRHGLCNAKTLNLLENVLAKEKAVTEGAEEAVLHRGSLVTECSHSNISIIKNRKLTTHPANEQIYDGTGRDNLIKKCKDFGVEINERPFSLRDLFTADEVILTSVTCPCTRVTVIDRTPVGGNAPALFGNLEKALYNDFEKI